MGVIWFLIKLIFFIVVIAALVGGMVYNSGYKQEKERKKQSPYAEISIDQFKAIVNRVSINDFRVETEKIMTKRFEEYTYSRRVDARAEEHAQVGLSGYFSISGEFTKFQIYVPDKGIVEVVFPNVIEELAARFFIMEKISEAEQAKKEKNKVII